MTGNFPLSEAQKRELPGLWEYSGFMVSKTDNEITTREQILRDALQIVTKDRNQDYGNPEDNFATIANYWTTYLQSKHLIPRSENLVASDVAAMMILMKCSRLATSPNKLDHWIDIAGYSSCGGDCVQ